MSAHTPGPWVVDFSDDGRAPVRITTAAPVYSGATMPAEIARMTKLAGRCGHYHANARLIAAAPQLVEALTLIAMDDSEAATTGRARTFRDVARAALAKAGAV